jgi:hypothetical protein
MKNETQKLKKGDKLCDLSGKIYTVNSIGTKYFYCVESNDKFCLEKLRSVNAFRTTHLSRDIQGTKDRVEKQKIQKRLFSTFKSYGECGVSLDALRQINAILDNDKPKSDATI